MKMLSFLNVAAMVGVGALLWWQSLQLDAVRSELGLLKTNIADSAAVALEGQLRDIRTDLLSLREEWTTAETTSGDLVGTNLEGQLRRVGEIDQRMAQVVEGDVLGLAGALVEVDEWTFHPTDQDAATKKLEALVADLRLGLEAAVFEQLKQALKAPSGSQAKLCLARAGDLFSLFPQPETDVEKQGVQRISNSIVSATNRVGELSRLRYNQWVANNVQSALKGFYENKKTFGNDDTQLINSFISTLGTTDPAYLDPAVSAIYQHVLSITTEALEEPNRVELAKRLSSPDIQRKTSLDF